MVYILFSVAILLICSWVSPIEGFDTKEDATSRPTKPPVPTTTAPPTPTPCVGCNSECCQSCMNQLSCTNANCKWYAKKNEFNGGRCSVPYARELDEVTSGGGGANA
jgi:hypothetical protein